MKQYTDMPTVSQLFMMTFGDQAVSEGVDGPICLFGAITMDIHIIEESYLYIMFLNVLLMIYNNYDIIYCHTYCAAAVHDDF